MRISDWSSDVCSSDLVVLWVGIGIWSKILLVFVGAVFPILINTYVGAKDVDSQMRLAARAFGASRREQFITILIPGALPHINSGLRLGAIQDRKSTRLNSSH